MISHSSPALPAVKHTHNGQVSIICVCWGLPQEPAPVELKWKGSAEAHVTTRKTDIWHFKNAF